MKLRKLMTILVASAILTGTLVVSGCDNHSGNEWQRVVCEVSAINQGAPFVSAYMNAGADKISGTEDDYYPIDFAPVTFYARSYNDLIVVPEDGVYSWFHITNYDLIWHPSEDAPDELTDYNVTGGMCDLIVPLREEATVAILLADRGMKEQPWYRDRLFVNGDSYTATAEMIFYGHETGNDQVVALGGGITVTFIGVVIGE